MFLGPFEAALLVELHADGDPRAMATLRKRVTEDFEAPAETPQHLSLWSGQSVTRSVGFHLSKHIIEYDREGGDEMGKRDTMVVDKEEQSTLARSSRSLEAKLLGLPVRRLRSSSSSSLKSPEGGRNSATSLKSPEAYIIHSKVFYGDSFLSAGSNSGDLEEMIDQLDTFYGRLGLLTKSVAGSALGGLCIAALFL